MGRDVVETLQHFYNNYSIIIGHGDKILIMFVILSPPPGTRFQPMKKSCPYPRGQDFNITWNLVPTSGDKIIAYEKILSPPPGTRFSIINKLVPDTGDNISNCSKNSQYILFLYIIMIYYFINYSLILFFFSVVLSFGFLHLYFVPFYLSIISISFFKFCTYLLKPQICVLVSHISRRIVF